jgi:O-antigen ligase
MPCSCLRERPNSGLVWRGGALSLLAEHLKPFNVPAGIAPVFENDLLHYAAVSGLVGVLSVVALYGGVFAGLLAFVKSWGHRPSRMPCWACCWWRLYFEFGLSVNALGRNAFRYFFCAMSVMLLGLILLAAKDKKGSDMELIFLCPAIKKAIGGVKVIYRQAELIHKLGQSRGIFRCGDAPQHLVFQGALV